MSKNKIKINKVKSNQMMRKLTKKIKMKKVQKMRMMKARMITTKKEKLAKKMRINKMKTVKITTKMKKVKIRKVTMKKIKKVNLQNHFDLSTINQFRKCKLKYINFRISQLISLDRKIMSNHRIGSINQSNLMKYNDFAFGKSTNNRKNQPSMFQLLSWPLSISDNMVKKVSETNNSPIKLTQKEKIKEENTPKKKEIQRKKKEQENEKENCRNRRPQTPLNKSNKFENKIKSKSVQKNITISKINTSSQKYKKFIEATRLLPNTSFQTYFGKPPFENYGYGNTKSCTSGIVYGNYLYSHNVCPHRGTNLPQNLQCYPEALKVAKERGPIFTVIPRKKFQDDQQTINSEQKQHETAIYPQQNTVGSLEIQNTTKFEDQSNSKEEKQKTQLKKVKNQKNNSQKLLKD